MAWPAERRNRLWERTTRRGIMNQHKKGVVQMYALVLEEGEFEFLIDPQDLWSVPRVVVRSGWREAEVWLDEQGVSFRKPGKFGKRDERRILDLVDEHLDELLDAWFNLREDVRRDRLDRNILVD
jgi:hypothetical protein